MNLLEGVLLLLHVGVAAAICGFVLLQHGKGADMGAAFGSGASGSLFGASGSANFLSHTTAVLAAVFFFTSIGLTWYASTHVQRAGLMERSVLDKGVPGQAAPEPPRTPCRSTPRRSPRRRSASVYADARSTPPAPREHRPPHRARRGTGTPECRRSRSAAPNSRSRPTPRRSPARVRSTSRAVRATALPASTRLAAVKPHTASTTSGQNPARAPAAPRSPPSPCPVADGQRAAHGPHRSRPPPATRAPAARGKRAPPAHADAALRADPGKRGRRGRPCGPGTTPPAGRSVELAIVRSRQIAGSLR